jgi:CheY-like chemotaxis protein
VSLILIADDNPHAHRMGQQILSQEGHDVVTVSDGDEALQYLADHRPDLVMVDTRMPGPNGFDICSHVKKEAGLEGVKVVLLAGPLEPFDPAQAESAGSDAVLHKPLDAYSLIDTVNSLLGATKGTLEDSSEDALGTSAAAVLERSADPLPSSSAPSEAPRAAAASSGSSVAVAVESDDPLADLVDQALGTSSERSMRQERVRKAVREVLEASFPALADALVERVLARLDEN